MTQCFCATAIVHNNINIDIFREKYPQQFNLKCTEIVHDKKEEK